MLTLLLVIPLAADAQATKVFRIGVLTIGGVEGPAAYGFSAFRQGLRELGYVEGQNVTVDVRSADGRRERLQGLAADLVRLKVDVIVAGSNPSIAAVKQATTTIPIVMTMATDPVAVGFVAGLGRPEGNITGMSVQTPDIAGKRLQLLRDVMPNLSRVAILWDPGYPSRQQVVEAEAAARTLGVQIRLVEMQGPSRIDAAFATMSTEKAGALFIAGSDVIFVHRAQITELATRHRLPTTCPLREWGEVGCLISYGPSVSEQWSPAAYFVDRIRRGAKPADLPVEQPTKFDLVVNLKTAKAVGVTIPQPVLLRADYVIP